MSSSRRGSKIGLAAVLTLVCGPAFAQEAELKSAYIFNFTKFTTIPGSGSYVVGIVGDEPLIPALERTLSGKSVGDRPIVVRRVSTDAEFKRCSMLFISASERPKLDKILSSVRTDAILTLADSAGFASKGVMINMVLDDSRVRFEINLGAARTAKVAISARLLGLAKEVIN